MLVYRLVFTPQVGEGCKNITVISLLHTSTICVICVFGKDMVPLLENVLLFEMRHSPHYDLCHVERYV